MRQGQQQNRRGRGRNNNNRKGQSPLTRSFESNGPDVKIRGTPSHIAEKYMALARDSMSSGDPVLAENYLQHAEHYNRIIMAFREQQSPNGGDVVNGGNNRFRSPQSDQFDGDELGDEDADDAFTDNQQPMVQPSDPQPAMPVARSERADRNDRPERSDRGDDQRQPRERRPNGSGGNAPRQRSEGGREGGRSEREPRRPQRQRFGESGDQPDFLRRPIRRTRREDVAVEDGGTSGEPAAAAVEESQD